MWPSILRVSGKLSLEVVLVLESSFVNEELETSLYSINSPFSSGVSSSVVIILILSLIKDNSFMSYNTQAK